MNHIKIILFTVITALLLSSCEKKTTFVDKTKDVRMIALKTLKDLDGLTSDADKYDLFNEGKTYTRHADLHAYKMG